MRSTTVFHGISQNQTEQTLEINTTTISENTKELINSINENTNISDEDKECIIENFSLLFETNMKYINNTYNLCEKLKTLKITYDLKSPEEIKTMGVRGQYTGKDNQIFIYKNEPNVLLHEVMHAISGSGSYADIGSFVEGYTELFNPKREKDTYDAEQIMVIVYEQIYGKDFMRHAYFSSNMTFEFYDRFYLEGNFYDSEHSKLMKDVNSFLVKYSHGNNRLDELKNIPEALSELNSIFERLNIEYEAVTGEKWEDNEILKICYDRFFGGHTSDKHNNCDIFDVFVNTDGNYFFTKGKNMQIMYSENTGIIGAEISEDFEIG